MSALTLRTIRIKFRPDFHTAIRAGLKTQTRRPIRPQPNPDRLLQSDALRWKSFVWAARDSCRFPTPYGQPGDRLTVEDASPPIRLEVLNVRAERLREITGADIWREGFPGEAKVGSSFVWFSGVWDDIYKGDGFRWIDNPFCWVIDFRVIP